jgi:putative ABC transport system permease protein
MVILMINLKLLFRWSFRDLRERKIQVIAISLIIGLGTGAYVGLSSTTVWRQYAFDESNKALNMFDIKLELTAGSWVNQATLKSLLKEIPHFEWIKGLEFRSVFSTSVNVTSGTDSVLADGRVIGINVSRSSENLNVNGLHIEFGRHIQSNEKNAQVCVVENNFAKYHKLKPEGQNLTIPGGIELSIVGTAQSPEYFMVVEANKIMAEASFCALFVPLQTVQEILYQIMGLPLGHVNEALFLVTTDADSTVLKKEIKTVFEENFPSITVNFLEREDQPTYKTIQDDIPGDQSMYIIFSFLILFIAAFGAFNLISRVINSQRRQIGINMALGVQPSHITYRYLILSFEIAFLGVCSGLLFAVIIGNSFGTMINQMIPLPKWKQWLVIDLFLQGAGLGIIIPFLACIIPIVRILRLRPIQAIQTGVVISTGKGAAPLLEKLHFPGSIFFQLPFRNLARNPRRTVSTIIGVALAICVIVAVSSWLDGGTHLLIQEKNIMEGNNPERLDVTLNNFYNISQSPVTQIVEHPDFKIALPAIQVPGKLINEEKSFEIALHFFDLSNEIWSPNLTKGNKNNLLPYSGIILPQKAAMDLKIDVGDLIKVELPFRLSFYEYTQKNCTIEVIGIYGSQVRFWAFMDISESSIMNCSGFVNTVMAVPRSGITYQDINEDLFNIPGFKGVQPISKFVEAYEQLIELFTSIFAILQYTVMVLAFLIVFNTSSINVDERTREFATMGAFGTPIRTSIWILMIESFIVGVFGTIIGFFPLGFVVLGVLKGRIDAAMPEINLTGYLYPESIYVILLIGIVLVTLTPLITIRKLIKMDLPSSLRVVE